MNDVYHFIAVIVYGIFIVQFTLSWFGGDTDLMGEIDVTDMVSFKGITHFLMGFTGWLSLRSEQWYDYLIAFFLGIMFVIILYYIYKCCMKLQHQIIPESGQQLVGKSGVIYLITNCHYVTTEINGRTDTIGTYPEEKYRTYKKGDEVLITKFENNKYYFI